MQTINLNPFTMDYIQQGRARLVQVIGTGANERELEIGNVTTAEVEMEVDSTDVFTSNLPVRTKIGSLTNDVSAKLPFTVQSLTPDVRAWSVLGLEEAAPLAADPNWSKEVGAITVGDRIPLGRPVDEIESDGMQAGIDFVPLDNGRSVLIKAKPGGVTAPVTFTGKAPAFSNALKIAMGKNANREIRLRLYGNEQGKRPFTLDVIGIVRPTSAVGYIGENDVVGAEFELSLNADETGSLGTLQIF